ncbi:MAG: glycosyltransferase [Pirellulales bacterium]
MSPPLRVLTAEPEPIPGPPAGHRPRFSVMVPTCNPDEKFIATLESVLHQDPGPEGMQIAVVDDASDRGHVAAVVERIDPTGRIEVFEHGRRLGLSGNWNRAIALARGHLVHLLHQDDLVSPGFYARMDHGFRSSSGVGMAFCRSRIVDVDGRVLKTSSRQRWFAGVLDGWLPTIAERQRIQTPAAIVARSTYEKLGGYRGDLCHALDWEMWVRIAAHCPVWYEPRPLATYRRHDANETSRLVASGEVWPDMARAIRINAASLPPHLRSHAIETSVRWHAASALRTAKRQLAAGATAAAADTLRSLTDLFDVLDGEPPTMTATRQLAAIRSRIGAQGRWQPAVA